MKNLIVKCYQIILLYLLLYMLINTLSQKVILIFYKQYICIFCQQRLIYGGSLSLLYRTQVTRNYILAITV